MLLGDNNCIERVAKYVARQSINIYTVDCLLYVTATTENKANNNLIYNLNEIKNIG